ncbi:MAG: hypothetical protein LBB21_07100 [Holosporaceae bacterium]|nr:hypothetical protein [Holosporaceae bacterium]
MKKIFISMLGAIVLINMTQILEAMDPIEPASLKTKIESLRHEKNLFTDAGASSFFDLMSRLDVLVNGEDLTVVCYALSIYFRLIREKCCPAPIAEQISGIV